MHATVASRRKNRKSTGALLFHCTCTGMALFFKHSGLTARRPKQACAPKNARVSDRAAVPATRAREWLPLARPPTCSSPCNYPSAVVQGLRSQPLMQRSARWRHSPRHEHPEWTPGACSAHMRPLWRSSRAYSQQGSSSCITRRPCPFAYGMITLHKPFDCQPAAARSAPSQCRSRGT